MNICGSCYSMVEYEDGTVVCPRCGMPLEPTWIDILRRFVANGIDLQEGGVTLTDARKAVKEGLTALPTDS